MVFSYLLIADEHMHLSIELDSEHVIVLYTSSCPLILTSCCLDYHSFDNCPIQLHSTQEILQPKTVAMNISQEYGAAMFFVQTNSLSIYISI